MPFLVIQPPADENRLAEAGKEIYEAGIRLGLSMDVEGFIHSWVTGLRVLAERNAEGAITGLCLMALGKRWTRQDYTASILELRGEDHDAMLEFAKQIASAMGATSLFHETSPPFPTPVDGKITRTVTEFILQ